MKSTHLTAWIRSFFCVAFLFFLGSVNSMAQWEKVKWNLDKDAFISGVNLINATSIDRISECGEYAIGKTDHNRMSVDFGEYFKARVNANDPLGNIDSPKSEVVYTSLKTIMDALVVASPHTKGLVVHYGLSNDMKLVYAFCPVALKEVADTRSYSYEEPRTSGLYVRKPDGTLDVYTGGLDEWEKAGKERSLYFERVEVKRTTDGVHSKVIKGFDRWAYCLPWSQLEAQMDQNDNGADKPTIVVFSSLAEPMLEEPATRYGFDFRHSVCTYMKNSAGPMLEDDPRQVGACFFLKAANLGTPCPPRCKVFKGSWQCTR